MAANRASTTNGAANAPEKTYFEQQREMLVTEIAQVCLSILKQSCQPAYTCAVPRNGSPEHQQAEPVA
jgi:hypothetical protein